LHLGKKKRKKFLYPTKQNNKILCTLFGCISVKFSYKHGRLLILNPKQIYFMSVKLEKCQINEICLAKQAEGLQIYLHIGYFILQSNQINFVFLII